MRQILLMYCTDAAVASEGQAAGASLADDTAADGAAVDASMSVGVITMMTRIGQVSLTRVSAGTR